LEIQHWKDLEIRRYSGFEDAEADWLEIENEAEVYPFQRYAWLKTWQDTLGTARGVEPCIALFRGPGKGPEAGSFLLPLGLRRARGLMVLEWLGDGVSDYRGPLVCGPMSGAVVHEALLREARHLGCDYLSLENMPERGPRGRRSALTGEGSRKLHYEAHGLMIPADLEGYFASRFTSKERYNLRRAEKKLGAMGALRFAADAQGPERARITECMIAQKRERYRLTGAVDNFAEEAFGEFYRRATASGAGCLGGGASVRVSALYLDERVIACHWGVADRGDRAVYFLMPTFDAEFSRYSPGLIFLGRFIADCAADGFERLDFTVGDEIYKDKWCGDETPLYSMIRGFSAPGIVCAAALNGLEDLKSGPLLPLARDIKRAVLKHIKYRD